MKRLAFALATLGFSTASLATLPTGTDPSSVNVPLFPSQLENAFLLDKPTHSNPNDSIVQVPQLIGRLIVGVTGFYLKPNITDGDLVYANILDNALLGTRELDFNPDYSWDWGVNAGFVFPQSSNDVNLSYFHFGDNESTQAISLSNQPIIFPFGSFQFDTVAAKADISINQWDLTLGQYICVGSHLSLHPNVGARYAEIDRSLDSNFNNPPGTILPDLEYLTLDKKSDFNGLGPLAGLDVNYYLTDGVSLVGHFDSALLIGKIDAKEFFAFGTNPQPAPEAVSNRFTTLTANSIYRIVPALDEKLGVSYTLPINSRDSELVLEGGYQASQYFNPIDSIVLGTAGSGPNVRTVANNRVTSDLHLNGPYVNLTLRF